MKIAIHPGYGVFRLPREYRLANDIESEFDDCEEIRKDPKLIEYIENHEFFGLEVEEVPDEATDYLIEEYDGAEYVIYVMDGKIHFSR